MRAGLLRVVGGASALCIGWTSVATVTQLPTLGEVLAHWRELATGSAYWSALGATSFRWAVGCSIGVVIGLVCGLLSMSMYSPRNTIRFAGTAFVDALAFLRAIPIIALPAILISLAGLHEWGKIFVIGWGTAFPVWLGTLGAWASVDAEHLRVARASHFPKLGVIRHVIVPSAMQQIFAAVRLAAGVGWLCVVAAELLGIVEEGPLGFGLGADLWQAMNLDRVETSAALMGTFGLLGLSTDIVFRRVERTLFVYAFATRK